MGHKPLFTDRTIVVAIILAVFFLFLLPHPRVRLHSWSSGHSSPGLHDLPWSQSPADRARNTTLGFESIVALSRGTSWRLHGLHAAARLTSLDIEVPKQPYIDDEAVAILQASGPDDIRKPTHGSAIAWLAHLDLLKYVIQRRFTTTLIMEDDADWATEIKDQMATLTQKIPEFTNSSSTDAQPYGSGWDVLWLGHCGDVWHTSDDIPTLTWADSTVGRREDWRGAFSSACLEDLPEGHRSVFWARQPVCSFAYAVNAEGASKVLEWAIKGADEAFDVKLARGCTSGPLRCLTVADQLFQQYKPPPELGQSSDIVRVEDNADPVSEDERMQMVMGSTAVIPHSARCEALFNSTCLEL